MNTNKLQKLYRKASSVEVLSKSETSIILRCIGSRIKLEGYYSPTNVDFSVVYTSGSGGLNPETSSDARALSQDFADFAQFIDEYPNYEAASKLS